jgi:hypothetical protein
MTSIADVSTKYSLKFLIQSSYDETDRYKTYQFALLVLVPSAGSDGVIVDHRSISDAETIGEKIIQTFKKSLTKPTTLGSTNGVSVRNISNSDLCGIRYELQLTTIRNR